MNLSTPRYDFLQDRAYTAVSLTHFFVDILNNSRTLLVAVVAIALGLTNAQVGIALILYNVGSALAQPFFGWLADRTGPRWLVIGGLAWMIVLYGLSAVSEPWVALVALTLAGFGSGAFHPTGAMVAGQTSTTNKTQATAIFFMMGQLGLFLGPILAGALLDGFGRIGYLLLPALALIAVVNGYQHLHGHKRADPVAATAPTPVRQAQPVRWPIVAGLVWLMLLLNTVSIATMNFAPKLFTEMGFSGRYAGATSGAWMLGSAAGGLVGGWLADRYGNRIAIGLGLLGAIAPLYFFVPVPGLWRIGLLVVAGFFGGMPHSVLVLMAQWMLPRRQAFASGLSLGFMFMAGAIGSYLVGKVADATTLAATLQGMALLIVIALPGVLPLPNRYTPRID